MGADKEKKVIHFKEVTEVVDMTTGELSSIAKRTKFEIDREPNYVKLYLKDIIRLKGLPPSTTSVLNALLQSMGYNNIIPAYAPIKKLICRDLNISMDTLNKAIDNLYKQDILIRLDRGIYMADPDLFGRGSWSEIKEIRMMITYDESGKKQIKADIEKDQLRLF